METLIPDPNALSPLAGAVKNRFGGCVLGTEVRMNVDESLVSRISSFSGTFTFNDVELKNAGLFTNSPSDLKRNRRDSHETNPEFFCDSTLASKGLSGPTPLPPFHHFRLPPPPHPSIITPAESSVTFAVGSVSTTCSDVVDSAPFHSDVVHAEPKPSLTQTSCTTPGYESKERSRSKLTNCSSAPSAIPPFKGKGKNSRLFSQDRRRATLHNPEVPGELHDTAGRIQE